MNLPEKWKKAVKKAAANFIKGVKGPKTTIPFFAIMNEDLQGAFVFHPTNHTQLIVSIKTTWALQTPWGIIILTPNDQHSQN